MDGNVLFGKYEMGRLLGRGAFAKVFYARNIQNGLSVAIKVIDKQKVMEKDMMSNVIREITIMGRLRHPNIVRLYEVFASKKKVYIVIEFAKGGALHDKVFNGRRFSEELSRKLFQQLISAVGYCHLIGVSHRDLKLQNLLLMNNGSLKVSDFGLSAIMAKDHLRPHGLLRTFCGTPYFVAPEILRKKEYDGAMVDVWSCGVILYVLTAGNYPFYDANEMAMYIKIMEGKYRFPKWMSPDLMRFLGRLLETNPKNRITINEIIQDPWFIRGGLFKDKGPEFKFPFYHDYHSDDLDDSSSFPVRSAEQHQQPTEQQQQIVRAEAISSSSSSSGLNAFNLLAFSPSLDLSRLFFIESDDPFLDDEKFLSALPVDKIIATIGEAAAELNVNIRIRIKDCVESVDLVGQLGDFIARLVITPLTEKLVVVDVKIKRGATVSNNNIWKKMRPKLSGLVYDFKSQPEDEIDTTQDEPTPAD